MPVHIRPALDALPAYTPGRSVPGAVKLASNEIAFPPLQPVTDAIAEAAARGAAGINRYPDNGAQALTRALGAMLGGVDPGHIIAGCGSVALCQQLVQATCDAGDEVLFGWRSFEAYPILTGIVGAKSVTVPVTPEHRLNLPALAAAVTDRTRVAFVCTPNNPTGTLAGRAEIAAFLDAVPETVLVVLDEAYSEFVTDPDAPSGLEFVGRPNVLSLRTMSKAYGLAGLRVGYAVGSPELIAALRKVAIPFAVNYLAQAAAVAALGCREDLAPEWKQVTAERERVTAALRGLGFQLPESQGNFVWLPLRERSAEFAAHTEAAKVIVRPFNDATGGVRVSIGAPPENDQFLAAAGTFPL